MRKVSEKQQKIIINILNQVLLVGTSSPSHKKELRKFFQGKTLAIKIGIFSLCRFGDDLDDFKISTSISKRKSKSGKTKTERIWIYIPA